MTDEQIVEVLAKINMLDPVLTSNYTQEQLLTYIGIAEISVAASGTKIPDDVYVLAIAVKTLSLLTIPENSSLSKKKIKDVEVTYFQGQGKSKWDSLFDAIVSGDVGDDKAIWYVGI